MGAESNTPLTQPSDSGIYNLGIDTDKIAVTMTYPAASPAAADPVCGAPVPEDSEFHTMLGGVRRYFCSRACLHRFVADPTQYVTAIFPSTGFNFNFGIG